MTRGLNLIKSIRPLAFPQGATGKDSEWLCGGHTGSHYIHTSAASQVPGLRGAGRGTAAEMTNAPW